MDQEFRQEEGKWLVSVPQFWASVWEDSKAGVDLTGVLAASSLAHIVADVEHLHVVSIGLV